mgnify:FL=1
MAGAKSPLILVVEDDTAVRSLIGTSLDLAHYRHMSATSGAAAIAAAATQTIDVILLDLGLPDMDGVEVIKKIRSWSEVPIIVISARSEDSDKVVALDIGADDYITKPFSIEEFLARLRVALRKRDLSSDEESIFVDGELVIDYSAGIARLSGKELQLTGTEYRLLCLLAQNVGKVLTHNYILKKIWNSSSNKDRESLRVFMRNLRKKIEDDPSNPRYIQTQGGVGYRMLQR